MKKDHQAQIRPGNRNFKGGKKASVPFPLCLCWRVSRVFRKPKVFVSVSLEYSAVSLGYSAVPLGYSVSQTLHRIPSPKKRNHYTLVRKSIRR